MAILVERDNIGLFGKMNSGKSSVMNLLTQQETSIVDKTPGTTADTKVALIEFHGIGPIKLFDTAGLDESDVLGEKKRKKVFNNLKECDLVIVIIDPETEDFTTEQEIITEARDLDKQLLIIYNLFSKKGKDCVAKVEQKIPLVRFYKTIEISANDQTFRDSLISFVIENFQSKNSQIELLPFLVKNEYYILIIPMDEETPPGRYLRPQAMVEEYITRHWAYPISFRLDLGKARSKNPAIHEEEYARYLSFVNNFKHPPKAMVTDSQAMDIMSQWCPKEVLLTTFSIVMINYISKGKLQSFVEGVKALSNLKEGDRVLIAEACNHSRIGEDIGTVQIPNYINEKFPGVVIEHNFGREFENNEDLKKYKLIIHCGGCMISAQKLAARLRDLDSLSVPYTNYGVFLSFIQGTDSLQKVLEPWGLKEVLNT